MNDAAPIAASDGTVLRVHAGRPDAPIAVEVTRGGMVESVHRVIAAVVDAGSISKPKRSVPENAETDAEAPHHSATLSMTETSSATMSWACAAGAAKAAEAWATATNPGARAAPAFAAGAPGAERSHSAWRAAGAAAHFLASLLTAVTRGSDAQASAAAVGAAAASRSTSN